MSAAERRHAAVLAIGGPLVLFAFVVAGAVSALPPAGSEAAPPSGTAADGTASGWVALGLLLLPVSLGALWWLLRRPRGLPPTPWPPNVVAAAGLAGLFLWVLLGGVLVWALGEGDWAQRPLVRTGVAELAWGVAAIPAWVVLGPPAEGGRRWAPVQGAAVWAAAWPLAAATAALNVLLLEWMGRGAPLQAVVTEFMASTVWERAAMVVPMVLLAPLFEELVCRGAIYRGLRDLAGVRAAAIGSALLFAAMHGVAAQALPIFLLGLVLALLYERSGSLLAPIAAHAVHNGVALAFSLLA